MPQHLVHARPTDYWFGGSACVWKHPLITAGQGYGYMLQTLNGDTGPSSVQPEKWTYAVLFPKDSVRNAVHHGCQEDQER